MWRVRDLELAMGISGAGFENHPIDYSYALLGTFGISEQRR
jgi:hypothetical protein